ncbi:nucleoside recognition domain-containing protein [Kangiella koreensis]|uniref:Nucleoside recognition domain protein n=1 Tax=Kangiella koreensis (strain DSM 16069 / JCM 12317 / KCTC 12182 / SW-125) TaxID=523791 RepID=C7RA22_KANKD|nr:spore maturation protein [Kangiella koreensis]ACV26141.1 nucleoside recognition domain protein [Kangiella koreensis DSM 16069]
MLNILWLFFFVLAFVLALFQWLVQGNAAAFPELVQSIFDMAKLSVTIAIGLIGILAFWLGLLKIAEKSGLVNLLAKALAPLFRKLMPEVPSGHPALGSISMNMAANMLGLDNAATPMGIRAMEQLQEINPNKEEASNAQILFLVLNTSAVTIIPITILLYRAQMGAADPAAVFLPLLLATCASTFFGLLAVSIVQKIDIFNRVIAAYFLVFAGLIGALVWSLVSLPTEEMAEASSALGNFLLMAAIVTILLYGWRKKVAVYEDFVEGAKEGFKVAVKIIPYLIAMLTAIGALRASGALDAFADGLGWLFGSLGLDTRFVEALPTALMKPFSGSGSRAMMLETMQSQGVDSFVGYMVATIQGSTETTFYVLTVYFGAVGIKRIRHALACGLIADLAGIVAAILLTYWFFA